MGQAKIREQAYKTAVRELFAACDADATIVATSAIRLFDNFIAPKHYTGGCYLTTFTLHRYLAREHHIITSPIVGYVNDGTDDIFISHAWLEFQDLKTDLTLHLMEHSHLFDNGAMIVMDRVIRPGKAVFSYHLERPERGLHEAQKMLSNPEQATIAQHKEEEHAKMKGISQSTGLIEDYLSSAPPELSYDRMVRAIR